MRNMIWGALVLLLAACTRELPQTPANDGPFALEKHIIPTVVNPGKSHQVSVRMLGGAEVDSVKLTVLSPSSAVLAVFGLFDDGGAQHHGSGDQVAFDGYFSRNILWTGSDQAAELIWRFEAVTRQGVIVPPLEATVVSQKNSAPVLLSVEAPDTLRSGFVGTIKLTAVAVDSNGADDLAMVKCAAYQGGILAFEMVLNRENDRFAFALDYTFAVAKRGLFDFKYQAIDRSGVLSNEINRLLFIENQPPQLSEFSHADSVQVPEAGKMVAFLITVRVEDEQSAADIKSVKLEWKKPDGTFSKNSPFALYDNGLPWNEDFSGWDDGWRGDKVAGDGVYSITGIFDPNQPLGDYELTFYAEDFAGNVSARVTRIITLYPKPAGLSKSRPTFRLVAHHPFEGN